MSTVSALEPPYRGIDRRLRAREPASTARVAWGRLSAVVVVAFLLAGALAVGDPVRAGAIQDIRQVLRASLLSGAGLLLLGQWRASGLVRPALLGVAALLLGGLTEVVTALSPLISGAGTEPLSEPVLRLLPAFAAAGLIVAAGRVRPVDASARPLRLLLLAAAFVCFGGACLLLLLASTPAADDPALVAACAAWRGALWMAVAMVTHRAVRARRSDTPWLPLVLAMMAAVAFCDAAQALLGEPAGAVAAVLAVVSSALLLRYAAQDFVSALSVQSERLLRLSADITDHERRSRTAAESHAVRVHEVRNVLAGLHGATATLRRYEDRLDPGVRHRIQDAISAELGRLQHLVDPPPARARGVVVVRDALEPVLVSERQLGSLIRADLHPVRVWGCAEDVATICSALLVNARVHAPGSPVLLRARAAGGSVRISVDDAGPGVPEELREAVFARGERGVATAPGSGLGLHHARELATQMDGTLVLGSRSHGGSCFVLTLPAAPPAR